MNRQQRQLVTRGQIIALRDTGLSIPQIAQQLAISTTTVSTWITRNEETGNLDDQGMSLCL